MNNNSETSQIKLGLDFGTAYSVPAYKLPEKKDPDILLDENTRNSFFKGIPSIFWSDKARNVRVGIDAANGNAEWNDTKGVVRSIKTRLREKEIKLYDKTYTPQEIVVEIIRHIFDMAYQAMEENDIDIPKEKSIVMGVPVKFGNTERKILIEALKELKYDAELLPEPIAAAIYYAHKNPNKFEKTLVFDMGAGTFDTAFLEKNDNPSARNPYPYRCPDGGFDGNLKAGDAVDEALAEYIKNRLSPKPPKELAAALMDKNNVEYRQLLLAARHIKENMSSQIILTHNFSLGTYNGISATVTKEELEKVAAPIINEAVDMCYSVVKKCGMQNEDFSIIMVGGMSNLMMVKEALTRKFPHIKEKNIQKKNPTLAVAYGCALYAEQPVVSRRVAFGYAVASYYDNKSVLSVEIPADVKLPCVVESHYATRHQNQEAVEFRIYEVENAKEGDHLSIDRGRYCDELAVVHPFNRPVPIGTEVTFRIELTESGILNISVDDGGIAGKTTKKSVQVGIVRERNGG